MKYNILAIGTLIAAATAFTACENDGDIIYATGVQEIELSGTQTDIVLSESAQSALAMTLYWNENGNITTSNPAVAAPNGAVSNTIEFSDSPEFTNVATVLPGTGVYERQFTCRELNSLLAQLPYEGGVAAPLYIRIKGSLSANTDPFYSNVLTVNVTVFKVDMSTAIFLDKSKNDTGRTLVSPDENRIYSGFIGAGAWENWWLRESNGFTWGNLDVDGMPFHISSGESAWNLWYPGISGCYWTVVNIPGNEWSALLIPEIKIDGDIQGVMTYDRKANQWSYTFDAPRAGAYNVTLTATGKQYNTATGTDDAAAKDTPVAFAIGANGLTVAAAAQTLTVNVSAAGATTLLLDMADPTNVTLAEGDAAPVVNIAKKLYLSGIRDPWNFEWSVSLYDEDNLGYASAIQADSEWGYRIYKEVDAWDDYYTMAEGGNAYEGTLIANGEGNIAAPDKAFYFIEVSLGGMKYKLTKINAVGYAGLNDDWTIQPMTATATPGVYTATVTKSANTPWGVKILLNNGWDLFFGGNGTPGELAAFHDGFQGDNDLENGTYTLTVDLSNCTYSYTKE